LARRVVITGLGLVCGVGNTAPDVWRQLLAGASGMGPIRGFDATGFPVTFAAEVKNFDPLNFVDKKEARKMGRFIHFAFAATQEALAQADLKITPEIAERVGVFIGSGIGGFEIIELRRPGSHLGHRDGLRHLRQLHRRLGPHDPARRRGCDDRRRHGGLGHRALGRRFRRHARPIHAQRRAHPRQPPLR
jgi:3-oxoacyl-(acyl-carrier-protein) synthase